MLSRSEDDAKASRATERQRLRISDYREALGWSEARLWGQLPTGVNRVSDLSGAEAKTLLAELDAACVRKQGAMDAEDPPREPGLGASQRADITNLEAKTADPLATERRMCDTYSVTDIDGLSIAQAKHWLKQLGDESRAKKP